MIESLLSNDIPIITVEDHAAIGGFGSAVLEEASRRNLNTSLVTILGLPDRFIGHGSRKEQLEDGGIDTVSIGKTASQILQNQVNDTPVVVTP